MRPPFYILLLKAFRAQKNLVRPAMARLGLSPGQPKILTFLTLQKSWNQRELAQACEIEPATVSRLLDGMEGRCLIERRAVPGDKRALSISITEKGRHSQQKMEAAYSAVTEQSLQGFTPQERQQFEQYLRRMYKNLTGRTITGEEEPPCKTN